MAIHCVVGTIYVSRMTDSKVLAARKLLASGTPLHEAVCAGHGETVRLLVESGARLDIRDLVYEGTPLGWAIHCKQSEIADYLRARPSANRSLQIE